MLSTVDNCTVSSHSNTNHNQQMGLDYVLCYNWCPRSVILWKLFRNQIIPSCAEWWGEMDNRATTPFGYCPNTAVLPDRPHCTNGRWNRCQEALNDDNDCIVMLYSCTHMATVGVKELTRQLPVVSFQVATWQLMVVLKLLPAPYFPSIYIPPSCYDQTFKKCEVFTRATLC